MAWSDILDRYLRSITWINNLDKSPRRLQLSALDTGFDTLKFANLVDFT